MIVAIEGMVTKKEPTFLHVKDMSGITHKVLVSLQTSANVKESEKAELSICHIVREDAWLLFGFLDEDEKKVFEALVKVNGVGPATAITVCSTLSPKGFFDALQNGHIDAFKKVPGIGPKTAKRILVELSEFNLARTSSESKPTYHEATLALESLGFKKAKIDGVLKSCKSTTTSELIKEALQKLS